MARPKAPIRVSFSGQAREKHAEYDRVSRESIDVEGPRADPGRMKDGQRQGPFTLIRRRKLLTLTFCGEGDAGQLLREPGFLLREIRRWRASDPAIRAPSSESGAPG